MTFRFLKLHGSEACRYFAPLVELKLATFAKFPYLYKGDIDSERAWLETYLRSDSSIILIVEHDGKIIGASTGIGGQDEDENYRKPFLDRGIDPATIFFYGESMVLPKYRGIGLGKVFYEQREKYARSLPGIKASAMCILQRGSEHPLAPATFDRSRDNYERIWEGRDFAALPNVTAAAEWQDLDTGVPTEKTFQVWLKLLKERRRFGSRRDELEAKMNAHSA